MPDPSKHAALDALGFSVASTCGTCHNWTPAAYRAPTNWGRCALAVHEHGKHTGERRSGTPSMGTCLAHVLDRRRLQLAVGDDYATRYGGA